MRFAYQIPKNDEDFEVFCCHLLKRHWSRPQLQRHAHRGEGQDGVDIHDPSQTKPIRAAQCKLHDYGKTIPPKDIQAEVDKAKNHVPAIEQYTILTTAKKSKQADRKIAEINQLHQQQGLFTVEVLTWDQIELLLDQYSDVRDATYNTLSGQTAAALQHSITAIQAAVEAGQQPFQDSIDNELDSIKNELERHEIHVADRLASALTNESPISCRRGSDGVCCQSKPISCCVGVRSLQAGALLLQAKQHQPNEEKAQVNEAIGYELTGKAQKAHALSSTLRHAFPHSASAAACWVRTAPASVASEEIEASVSEFREKEVDVALALASCMLRRGDMARTEKYALHN